MAKTPGSVSIRTYQVGFGDCFLLSFRYAANEEKHVLIDFGSTGLPDGKKPQTHMVAVADDIAKRTKGKLHAVVATHRHKDHISGFETKANGKGPGDIIKALRPDLVVQPWTEDPDLKTTATGPVKSLTGPQRHVAMLSSMNAIASEVFAQARRTRHFAAAVKDQLAFLGEDNIANLSAVKNLMKMTGNKKKNVYAFSGSKSGLETVLPGVKVHVLGPPTVDQSDKIKAMKSKDADEFWHLQAAALRAAAPDGTLGTATPTLFPRHVRSRGPRFPIDSRWLINHARSIKGDQLLQIVRMLDQQMNNTSLILLFEVKNTRLLFPGDAQLENWQFALAQRKYEKLLESVNLYKVGHHGSLNATPKSLWAKFKNRSADTNKATRLRALMSTMAGKHGSKENKTEVPRRPLVDALHKESTLFSTQELAKKQLFHDTQLTF